MTGTPLLIGQIVTAVIFIAVGLGLVLWLFRGDGTPPAPPAADKPPEPGTVIRIRPPPPQDGPPSPR
jgi:flagellar basal body-associated protein FliL